MNYVVIGILLILVFIIIFCISWQPKLWTIPSKVYLDNVINNASYFYKLNEYDLLARHTESYHQYILKYKKSLSDFSKDEKRKLDELIDTIATRYMNKYIKLQKIPWIIVKFDGVENNFPHTIQDIIFLPKTFFTLEYSKQIETLIHEKIHIYQRTYPIDTAKLIHDLGFRIWGTQQSIKNIRTNPDTNSFVYSLDGTVQVQIYDTENPTDITNSHIERIVGDKPWDVPESVKQRDHPYEIMACAIAQLMVGSLSDHPMKNKLKL